MPIERASKTDDWMSEDLTRYEEEDRRGEEASKVVDPQYKGKFKLGTILHEAGLYRLGRILRSYSFARSSFYIIILMVISFFVPIILISLTGLSDIGLLALVLYGAFGFAAGLYYFIYGLLHFLDIGRNERRHLYSIFLPVCMFTFTFLMLGPWSAQAFGTLTNFTYGVGFIYIVIIMFPILLTMFLNSGFFCSVTLHGLIMRHMKKELQRSKPFSISVLLFLMALLALLLFRALIVSQDPLALITINGRHLPALFRPVLISLMLLFPFVLATFGFSSTINILDRIKRLTPRAESSFFLGVMIFSLYAYLWAIMAEIIFLMQRDTSMVKTILGIVLSVYYISAILGMLTLGSMKVLTVAVEWAGPPRAPGSPKRH